MILWYSDFLIFNSVERHKKQNKVEYKIVIEYYNAHIIQKAVTIMSYHIQINRIYKIYIYLSYTS